MWHLDIRFYVRAIIGLTAYCASGGVSVCPSVALPIHTQIRSCGCWHKDDEKCSQRNFCPPRSQESIAITMHSLEPSILASRH